MSKVEKSKQKSGATKGTPPITQPGHVAGSQAVAVEGPPQPTDAAGASPTDGGAEQVAGFEGSYLAFEAEAREVSDHAVVTFNGNALLVFHNGRRGVAEVMGERLRLESDPDAPRVDFARVEATVGAGEALVFAARRASSAVAAKSELQKKTSAVFELRDVLLSSAEAAVKAKVVTGNEAAKLPKIRKGGGAPDGAQDCIDLATWFRTNAGDLKGKTAVTAEQVVEAATLGSELLRLLTPAGAAPIKAAADPVVEAANMRDRMGVVFARYYAYVARVGGWLWGHDLANHVPPARSRSVSAATTTDVAPPATPATPVTPARPG